VPESAPDVSFFYFYDVKLPVPFWAQR